MAVYVIRMGETNYYKIGHTEKNAKQRLLELQTGNPLPLNVEFVLEGDTKLERTLHNMFVDQRQVGEWVKLTRELVEMIRLAAPLYVHKAKVAPTVRSTSIMQHGRTISARVVNEILGRAKVISPPYKDANKGMQLLQLTAR